jgi:PEP-CTERM motif
LKQPVLVVFATLAAASLATASPITYDINFTTTSGLAPTSGSFTYDAATTTFSNFIVDWDTVPLDFTLIANQDGGCLGSPTSPANAFVFLSTGCGGTRTFDGSLSDPGGLGFDVIFFELDGNQGDIAQFGTALPPSVVPDAIDATVNGTFTISPVTAAPEPASAGMFGLGFAGLLIAFRCYRERVRRRATA